MTQKPQPTIDLLNSVTECGYSIRKENEGRRFNYGVKNCIKSIASQNRELIRKIFLIYLNKK